MTVCGVAERLEITQDLFVRYTRMLGHALARRFITAALLEFCNQLQLPFMEIFFFLRSPAILQKSLFCHCAPSSLLPAVRRPYYP